MDFTMKVEKVNGDEIIEGIGYWKPTDLYVTFLKNASLEIPRSVYKVVVVLVSLIYKSNVYIAC